MDVIVSLTLTHRYRDRTRAVDVIYWSNMKKAMKSLKFYSQYFQLFLYPHDSLHNLRII